MVGLNETNRHLMGLCSMAGPPRHEALNSRTAGADTGSRKGGGGEGGSPVYGYVLKHICVHARDVFPPLYEV